MLSEAPYRLTVTELDERNRFLDEAIAASGQSADSVRALITSGNDRLARELDLEAPPLRLVGGSLRADGVVGVFRLSPSIELEIAPKYLGADDPHWREDFFFIATLSRFGRLFPRERLGAALTQQTGLVDLLGRAIVEMYTANQRRPLKTYRTHDVSSFELDGDVEPEALLTPTAEGFRQSITRFTRDNRHNQVIRTAAVSLLGGIRDPATRQQLVRVSEDLAPQTAARSTRVPQTVPSRHRRWSPLYDLSREVLSGSSLNLDPGKHEFAPGFVVRAAKSWEDLVSLAIKMGLPDATVTAQSPYQLGERNGTPFHTRPDVTIAWADQAVLVDAKYKGRADHAAYSATAADVYEGLAFMRAAKSDRLGLVYPRRLRDERPAPVGTSTPFELIEVGNQQIHAVEVEARGISKRNALKDFAQRIAVAVRDMRV